MSIPVFWADEFAFLKYNDIMYKSAAPAISKVSEIAARDGRPHAKIISTTPNNLESENGAFCKGLMDKACTFAEEMYDWSKEEILSFIEANSSNDFINVVFTWQELGLSEEWYKKECRALDNDMLLVRREIDLEWTKSSDNSVFSEEQLDLLFTKLNTPLHSLTLNVKLEDFETNTGVGKEKYLVTLYEELEKEKMYFIGVDTAGGLNKDFSTFTIVDPDTLRPIGFFKNAKINTSYFSSLLLELIITHLPNSILFIENNNYGKGVIDNLVRRIPKNLFYDYKVADKDKSNIIVKSSKNIQYGITTTGNSRPLMLDLLNEVMNEEPLCLAYPEIYDELKTLIYTKQGKIEHDRNAHDDTIFSYLFVRYAVAFSNNISKYLRDATTIVTNIKKVISNVIHDNIGNNDTKEHFTPAVNINVDQYASLSMQGLTPDQIIERFQRETSAGKVAINKSTSDLIMRLNK